MNLKQFLEYRTNCPFCEQLLFTSFAYRITTSNLTKDYLILTKRKYIEYDKVFYDVNYFLNLTENIFHINFNKRRNKVISNSILEELNIIHKNRFNDITNQDRIHNISMNCESCRRYNIISNDFTFDCNNYKLIGTDVYSINREYFYFSNLSLVNDRNSKNSLIRFKNQIIKTDLINFVSEEETYNKLKTLILFS